MRKVFLSVAALALVGCGHATSYVHVDPSTLGRVVVYRNGVAYFERTARVVGDELTLAVPADKIDDFLKSLTVVDARTGQPAPISYPTDPGATETGSGLVDMHIELPGSTSHEVKLTYVTEAPAWKPSYRVVLGADKKVDLDGWAIVDNTSGEDWKNVRLGVGASSALSFRFDLRSVHLVERETLQANDLFAQAPPSGPSTFGGPPAVAKRVVGDLGEADVPVESEAQDRIVFSDDPNAAAAASTTTPRQAPAPPPEHGKKAPGTAAGGGGADGVSALVALALRVKQEQGPVTIEGYAARGDADKDDASLGRANRVREQLIAQGVEADRLVAVGRGAVPGRNGGVRVLEAEGTTTRVAADSSNAAPGAGAASDPIGTSHFESGQVMTVEKGTSAMISILHGPTEGEVVYLYDPESDRGNAQFAFRSVRLRNPTDSQLESGPVTVFGDGHFIGEGLSEPIPPHQIAFVPFALDRQVVVDRGSGERDEIARIVTVNHGLFQTEVRHIKRTTLTIHNRLPDRTVVYVRHAVAPGYRVTRTPTDPEHAAGTDLYRVEVDGFGKQEVVIEEATPVSRTVDLRTSDGSALVRAYLTSAAVSGPLKAQVETLVQTQKDIADDEQRVATLRDQMIELRQRMDELHAQIVTLRAVRTAGPLMTSLEKKLQEVSDRVSKSTIDVVAIEERLMVSRIRFEDGVADLSLDADGKLASADTR